MWPRNSCCFGYMQQPRSNSCGSETALTLAFPGGAGVSSRRTHRHRHTHTHTKTQARAHLGTHSRQRHRTLLTLALQFNIYFRDFHAVQQKDCFSLAQNDEDPVNVVVIGLASFSLVLVVLCAIACGLNKQTDTCISRA